MRMATGLVALGALAASAAAGVIHVPQDQPSIQAAVDAAQTGDTVLISAGEYNESVVVQKLTGLTLKAKGKVVLGVQDIVPAMRITACNQIALVGLRFLGGAANDVEIVDSSDITLEKCQFLDSVHNGLLATNSSGISCLKCKADSVSSAAFAFSPGETDPPCDGVLVQSCHMKFCTTGIVVRGDAPVLEKNRIVHSSSSGISLLAVTAGSVSKNKITEQFGGIAIRVADTSAETEIQHNMVVGSGTGIDITDSQHTNVRHNKVKFDAFGCVFTGCADCTGEQNTVTCGDGWVVQISDHIQLLSNKLKGDDTGPGISLTLSLGCTVQGDKLSHHTTALNVDGDNNTLGDCSVSHASIGLSMQSGITNTQVSGLKLKNCSGDGMIVDGTGGSVSDCKIAHSNGDGMRVFGTAATITGNVITKSGDSGFHLEAGSTDNVLSANKAKGSHDFDLFDESGGMNDVQDDNQFGTTSP